MRLRCWHIEVTASFHFAVIVPLCSLPESKNTLLDRRASAWLPEEGKQDFRTLSSFSIHLRINRPCLFQDTSEMSFLGFQVTAATAFLYGGWQLAAFNIKQAVRCLSLSAVAARVKGNGMLSPSGGKGTCTYCNTICSAPLLKF